MGLLSSPAPKYSTLHGTPLPTPRQRSGGRTRPPLRRLLFCGGIGLFVLLNVLMWYTLTRHEAGESDEAAFQLTAEHLSYVNDQGERATVHGTWKVWAGNNGEKRAVEVTVA